jgi:hypothetical protein
MTAEFDWWLLIVGLVVGAGLVWLILAEWPRHDEELADAEITLEAGWIAAQLRAEGGAVEPATAELILRQHRAYLRLPPPDELLASSPPAAPAPTPAAVPAPTPAAVPAPAVAPPPTPPVPPGAAGPEPPLPPGRANASPPGPGGPSTPST